MRKVKICIILCLVISMVSMISGCNPFHTCKFTGATCVSRGKCECGKTGGKALGHTTKLGFCDRCDKFQNEYKDEINTISDYVLSAHQIYLNANTELIKKAQIYGVYGLSAQNIYDFRDELQVAISKFTDAINICNNNEDLLLFKNYIEKMRSSLSSINGSNVKEYWDSNYQQIQVYQEHYSEYNEYYKLLVECALTN